MSASLFIPRRFHPTPTLKRWAFGLCAALASVYALAYSPWRPLLVTTASVPRGLYLVHVGEPVSRGDFVAFAYQAPDWAQGRHYTWDGRVFVKQALGLPGDTVRVAGHRVTVCDPDGRCTSAGDLRDTDSAGRALPAYAHQDYPLRSGEVYAGALFSPRSYDSRYYGPVSLDRVIGRAYPLWTEAP